jgi:hypothetical protein
MVGSGRVWARILQMLWLLTFIPDLPRYSFIAALIASQIIFHIEKHSN